ncbi:putative LDLR chaperone boca-like isoform X1 [Apostichopus japonicus]|uniref:Putative LDLR chaperone boca-like isoform X1 n=1 Tax=Stichopus japonicus TaxID=307972 RepID=A0A2G8LPQ7_STIJA|nr:putative LDLR chaperone boca-like isoform X1 [Apostichopus japonicus]
MARVLQLRKIFLVLTAVTLGFCLTSVLCAEDPNTDEEVPASEKWKKKDIRDYNDADMERLYQQWEENDDEEPDPDDLSPYDKPKPKIDLSKLNTKDPEAMMKMTKRGQPIMMFVSLSGNPTKEETEKISSRWQEQLFNANFNFKRYVVGDDRLLFHIDDGSWAFDIKNFLIDQDRCKDVTIDQQIYYGRGSGRKVDNKAHIVGAEEAEEKKKEEAEKSKKKKTKKKKKKTTEKKDEL